MSEKLFGAEVTEEEYIRQISERLNPDELTLHGGFVLRLLFKPELRPPFAGDVFVRIIKMKQVSNEQYAYIVGIDVEDSDFRWTSFINSEGFDVDYEDHEKPGEYTEAGYYLGKTFPSDHDLASFMTNAEPLRENGAVALRSTGK